MQLYSTVASRNLIRAEQTMLKHAVGMQVLSKFGVQKEQPKNKTDTLVFRRVVPFGAAQLANPAAGNSNVPVINPANFIVAEGTIPTPSTISYQDVSVTLQKYTQLFKFSDKAELMYEDDIPQDMAEQTGEILGEITEKVCYGALKGGISVVYANGSTRAGIATAISLDKLHAASRALASNRARMVTKMIGPGPNFATRSVEPGYIVFCHTDCEHDVRALPGFTKREDYGSFRPIDDAELGATERYRFLMSPLFEPFLAAGAAVGSTGMLSVGAANVDVYPYIVTAADAWGQLKLAGRGTIKPSIISSQTLNHANPTGAFGYVGGSIWHAAVRLNENWAIRLEAGATAL